MTDPETFYQQTYQNLLTLKARAASYRNPTRIPAALLDQIEQYEKALFLTRQRLDGFMGEGDWRRAVKALSLAAVEPVAEEPANTGTEPLTGETTPVEVEYDLARIRDLLTKGFSDLELRNFSFDQPEFQEVYDQLAQTTGKDEIVSLIIEHADQHLLFEPLLAWAKKNNPSRYKKHQPYILAQK
jgi:hypothetical protein